MLYKIPCKIKQEFKWWQLRSVCEGSLRHASLYCGGYYYYYFGFLTWYIPSSGIAGSYGSCTYSFFLKEVPYCSPQWKWKSLCDPMDYTVHGILQTRILEWVAIPFSKGSSQPRNRTQVSHVAGRFFYHLSHQASPAFMQLIQQILTWMPTTCLELFQTPDL